MTFSSFNAGGLIQIQYEVFRKKVAPELVWYNGTIVGLELVSESKLRITVRFESSDSFDECDETFIADSAGNLNQKGRNFPFRLQSLATRLASTITQPVEGSVSAHPHSITQIMSKLSSMENRVNVLERRVSLQSIPPIYMTVCSMLNLSLIHI